MSGKAILIVGARGTGKTTTTKKLLAKVHEKSRIVLDINNEYKDMYPHPFIGFEDFAKKLPNVKDAFIVIEEATISLSNRGYNKDIADTLVRARHNNNTIVLVYHSLRSIPKYVFDLCNVVILHKTGDNKKTVEDFENDKLLEAYLWVNSQPNLKNKETGKEYSPQKVVILY